MGLVGSSLWPVTLSHGPIGLRPIAVRDVFEYDRVRARNAEWTGPWDSTRPPESDEPGMTFVQMARAFTKDARAGRSLPWMITWTAPGARSRLAGQMTLSGIVYGSARWCMAGYWVDGDLAGRGIAPTALALAGDYAFGVRKLHRLEVAIRPENVNSLRVVEKLGFRNEGMRERFMHVDHEWRDHLMFALHADEVGAGGLIGRLGR